MIAEENEDAFWKPPTVVMLKRVSGTLEQHPSLWARRRGLGGQGRAMRKTLLDGENGVNPKRAHRSRTSVPIDPATTADGPVLRVGL